ncbi:MAG: DUF3786 domain-containing protein [Deltaproteobacteria bacterium]|nr:DUF3786 domain-containing protein [Deltaproteobacteria bacterium]
MEDKESVFDRSYAKYLTELKDLSFKSIAPLIGGNMEGKAIKISLFGTTYSVSFNGIIDPSGNKPGYDICVILIRYILVCPGASPKEDELVSFRDLKDSGPLTSYFSNDVERPIASYFKGNLSGLEKACKSISGYIPDLDVNYDLAMRFDALPKISVILLFNDEDEEFPAKCSVLFERRAEKYLDAECIAMLAAQLFRCLKKGMSTP